MMEQGLYLDNDSWELAQTIRKQRRAKELGDARRAAIEEPLEEDLADGSHLRDDNVEDELAKYYQSK